MAVMDQTVGSLALASCPTCSVFIESRAEPCIPGFVVGFVGLESILTSEDLRAWQGINKTRTAE